MYLMNYVAIYVNYVAIYVNYVAIYVNYVMGVHASNCENWQCTQYVSILIFYKFTIWEMFIIFYPIPPLDTHHY
jgi:hypothetical protein